VVSVLATGPKVRGFKPGRGRWILMVIKSVARRRSHVVDLRHVKEPYEHEKMLVGKIQRPYFSPVFHLLRDKISMVVSPRDVSGGRIRMARSRLIVGLITYIVIYLSRNP
jgi:hypothetical protein